MAKQNTDKQPNKLENQALAYENIAFDSEKFLENRSVDQEVNISPRDKDAQDKIAAKSFSEQEELDLTNKKLVILQVIHAEPNIKLTKLRDICLRSIYMDYFTFIACLDDLVQNKIVICAGDRYALTESGTKIFDNLALTLPSAARELLNQLIAESKDK